MLMNKNAKSNLKPTVFEFVSYKFEPRKKRIFFNYKQRFKNNSPIFFIETIILPKAVDFKEIPDGFLNKIFESLHLMLGISYYKFYCPPAVAIAKAGATLSEKEAEFWNTVYEKGLGEFFYRNKLDPGISPKFPFKKNIKSMAYRLESNNKCLVFMGGGKDSIVASELLREQKFDATAFFAETGKGSDLLNKIIKKTGLKSIKIRRILDEKVFDKHKYNGHIPISAVYAFLGVLAAVLYKHSYCVVANEYSSNFGNIKYKGQDVNHQWSKSSEFESLFQDYLRNFITPDVRYFSLLRPFYEIRIAEMFSKYKKYFLHFSSCNKNFKSVRENKGLWCLNCPKCVFNFILLSAFLSKKELFFIFKKNLYQEKNLLPLFCDILGFGKMKPFDCVGTFEEARAALFLASKKFKKDFMIKTFLPRVKKEKAIIENVFRINSAVNIPSRFRFSGVKKVLILGYGKEGKISKRYIEKKYPGLKIGIADAKFSKNYLGKQQDYDLAIKTPGIPKSLVKIPYTTATNIFFSEVERKGNKIIGITGSKGKSTTSSIIYSILKEARKNVVFLGNIGKPMLEALLRPIKKDAVFVVELSSAQLEDMDFSPDISVVTVLFPEHMDYHKGLDNYYLAKKNIINFQGKDDCFVYNPKSKESVKWLAGYKGKAIPFAKKITLDDSEILLKGEHNRQNIKAAIASAKILNIKDGIINKAIKKFKNLPHRLEFVGEFKGIEFYDDAISTTPESTIAAIKSIKNVDTILLGGEDRGYDFSQLAKAVKKYKIRNIVIFEESGKRILKAISGNFNIFKTRSMEEAVMFAYKYTKKGGVCLLSSASPSYSLWKNFEEKGDQFKKIVKKMARFTPTP
ncbi:MAG: UDP-N-acetylmuramoyl-L-alanine--D-glutamate ligase [Candidatus Staskawiczbacteria bacterium]|nr:UDP-N-acetylmuramoyl-L-alanine--D-glutamate ligase [Candidatus Staskawiczbacteria bacterium]